MIRDAIQINIKLINSDNLHMHKSIDNRSSILLTDETNNAREKEFIALP